MAVPHKSRQHARKVAIHKVAAKKHATGGVKPMKHAPVHAHAGKKHK